MLGWGEKRMCRGYVKRLRRHQGIVTLGLGAGAVSLGSHANTVRRDVPTCLAMQGPGDQVVLALGHKSFVLVFVQYSCKVSSP